MGKLKWRLDFQQMLKRVQHDRTLENQEGAPLPKFLSSLFYARYPHFFVVVLRCRLLTQSSTSAPAHAYSAWQISCRNLFAPSARITRLSSQRRLGTVSHQPTASSALCQCSHTIGRLLKPKCCRTKVLVRLHTKTPSKFHLEGVFWFLFIICC